jgi:AmmeMemoRadiSam system protein B
MIRKAIYAGTWYPDKKKEIEAYLSTELKRRKAIAVVCPHAGWTYSGKVAGEVYSQVEPAALYVLVGPNHRGVGAAVSIYPDDAWETPLGNLPVEHAVVGAIIKNSKGLAQPDTIAHLEEHSLEVQMPFIKYFSSDAKIVPISLADYRPEACRRLGTAIADAVKKSPYAQRTLLVASTDMSHYVSAAAAKEVDTMAIETIIGLDPDGLLKTVVEKDISMCGSGPTAVVLWAAKDLGAQSARLIRYTSSGAVTGDNDEVVAYAGIIIE